MLHALTKQAKLLMTFFLSKSALLKNPDLHLKENIDQFLNKKKFRFVSKEDINQFLLKNSYLHLMKMQISFLIEKNSDLHLMKMQISFLIKKV